MSGWDAALSCCTAVLCFCCCQGCSWYCNVAVTTYRASDTGTGTTVAAGARTSRTDEAQVVMLLLVVVVVLVAF